MPGTYKAWSSTDNENATDNPIRDRLHPNSDEPYKLPSGAVIADSWLDLLDGTLSHIINEHTAGVETHFDFVWTGTYADGGSSRYDCGNWTLNAADIQGQVGHTRATNMNWSAMGSKWCNATYPLYCFQYKPPVP